MSKQLLVDVLKKSGMRTTDAGDAIDAITQAITKELKKNARFSLPGFGSFSVSKRGARMGRNPRTGEPIKIRASRGVRFKAGARLKATI